MPMAEARGFTAGFGKAKNGKQKGTDRRLFPSFKIF